MSTEADIRNENEQFNADANAEQAQEDAMTTAPATETEANETAPEEVDEPKGYGDMTEAELKDLAREWNDSRGLTQHDPGYIKIGQSKTDLVDDFEERDARREFFHRRGPGIRNHEGTTLKASQIEIHPLNPRHDVDYIDPKFQDFIQAEGGIADSISVVPSGLTNEDGDEVFWATSGNRRLVNLKEVLDEWEIEHNEYDVNVVIRTEADESEIDQQTKELDELKLLVNANESAWDLSVVDKFNAMREMEKRGMYQKDIAEELDVSVPYVSNVLKLRLVPEKVRDLVHYGHNADRFAEMGTGVLDKKGIPYHIDEDDNIVVHGISWKNALQMAKLVAKYQSENELSEKDAVEHMADFFLKSEVPFKYRTESGTGVLDAARILSQSAFKDWLRDAAISEGYFEGKATSLPKKRASMDVEPEGGDTEPTGDGDGDVEVDVKPEEGKVTVTDEETGEVETFDFSDIARALRVGEYTFSDKWEDPLIDELDLGTREAEVAVRFLIESGVLVKA